jgi:hypothetical protein
MTGLGGYSERSVMPTTYTDQFFVMDPGNPPAVGTFLTPQQFSYVDQNDNGQISPSGNDSFNGRDITSVWRGDQITVTMGGQTVNITGVTFYVNGGPAVFTPTDGTVLQNAVFQSSSWVTQSSQVPVSSFGPPCFVAGMRIETATGPRAVETLRPGDMVCTRDNGLQPVRWIGSRQVSGLGEFAPVCFAPGALGNARPLLVSPQHRMVLGGWQAELMFGTAEVLVAAHHLVDGAGICRVRCAQVRYVHLMFDRHEIVLSDGVPSESFHPGDYILSGDAALRAELVALFPELADGAACAGWRTARRVLRGHEAALLRGQGAPDRRLAA